MLFLAAGSGASEPAWIEPVAGEGSDQANAVPAPEPHLSAREAELLKRFDTNHDGKLDEHELAAAHQALLQEQMETGGVPAQRLYTRLLQSFDKKGEGKLDADEQAAALKYLSQHNPMIYQRLLQRFDKNGDGKLDAAESETLFQTLAALPKNKIAEK
jgi:EF-hand domain pair/EF hand